MPHGLLRNYIDERQLDRSLHNQLHQCQSQENDSDTHKSIANLLADAAEDSAAQYQSRNHWQRIVKDLAGFVRSKKKEGFPAAERTQMRRYPAGTGAAAVVSVTFRVVSVGP
jgi:hypothetical protein